MFYLFAVKCLLLYVREGACSYTAIKPWLHTIETQVLMLGVLKLGEEYI